MTLGDDLFSLCSFRFRGGSTTTKAHLTCDCELVSQDEGVVMYAHQDLLSIRSKVFKTMINEKQGLPVRLVIPCSVANLQTIGQFLYTDTIKLYSATQESLDELHSTAKLLELYKLVQFVDGLIPNNRSKLVTMPISSLERDLLQLLDNKELTNTVILWNEDDRPPIYASRTILSARSPYFEKIFNGQWCEPDRDSDNKWVIVMPTEIIHQTMRDIVHLMYHNKLPTIDLDRISELMQWSGFFVMDNMFDLCQLTLMRCINVENVCTLWRFADDIDAEELGQKCLKFFINHYSDVSRTEGFVTLKKTLLHSALISGHISFPRQLLIMDLEKWAKYQLETDFASRPGPMPLPSSQDFYNLLQDLLPPNTLFNLENRNRVLNHRPII